MSVLPMAKKSEAENYANLLKTLVVEAGVLAREMRHSAAISEKGDKTLVTEADHAVSAMIRDRLATFLKQENHILIDEETVDQLPAMDEVFSKEYQWVLDPIDGTSPFSCGMPFYAVSLGLLRKGEPWLGAVYLPELDELYYTNGKGDVARQRGARGAAMPTKLSITPAKVFDYTPVTYEGLTLTSEYQYVGKTVAILGSSVTSGVMFLNSQMAGRIDNAYIWDNAAVLAMAHTLGLKTVDALTGKAFDAFSSKWLSADWRLKQPIITALEQNIEIVQSRLKKK